MEPNRLRSDVLRPRATLSVAAAALLTMPITYYVYAQWQQTGVWLFLIGVWVFVISQLIVVWQGAGIIISCGLQGRRGKIRLYGIYLILYGGALLAMAFGFAILATFGGPSRDQQPIFCAVLWTIAVLLCVPAGIYLRRRSDIVSNESAKR